MKYPPVMLKLVKEISIQQFVIYSKLQNKYLICKICGQPLNFSFNLRPTVSHQRWHECQPDHEPDPIIVDEFIDRNEYTKSWENELVLWTLAY